MRPVLAENWVPSTTSLTTIPNSNSKGSNTLFSLPRALLHTVLTYARITLIHTFKKLARYTINSGNRTWQVQLQLSDSLSRCCKVLGRPLGEKSQNSLPPSVVGSAGYTTSRARCIHRATVYDSYGNNDCFVFGFEACSAGENSRQVLETWSKAWCCRDPGL